MKSFLFSPVMVVVLTLISLGLVAPYLVSAKSNEMVVMGIALTGVNFYYIFKFVMHIIKEKKNV